MSTAAPNGRGEPRWSVVRFRGGPVTALVPASMAGLPGSSARGGVGPPLSSRGPSRGVGGGAAGQGRGGGGGPAVVLQGAEPGVEGLGGRADLVAVDAVGQAGAAGAVPDQVVEGPTDRAADVRAGGGRRVPGHQGIRQ